MRFLPLILSGLRRNGIRTLLLSPRFMEEYATDCNRLHVVIQKGGKSRPMRQLFFDKGETFAACRFFAFSAMLSRIEHRPPELHRLSA